MKTNNRELKEAFREHIRSDSETYEKSCPRSEEIWGLFAGKNSVRQKSRMVDHITCCPSCLREFDAFLEMSRAEGKLIYEVQSRFRNQSRRAPFPLVWRYVTALLLLIAVLTVALLSTKWLGLAKRPEERGRLSGQLRVLDPGRELKQRLPLVFRWEENARGESYVIEIFDDSLLPFWKSPQITDRSYELPLSVKEKMQTGKSYFWMLTAFSQGGAKTESSLEEFRLID